MTSPRVPLDLLPIKIRMDLHQGAEWAREDIFALLDEVHAGRIERNRIASQCADQWDRADTAETRLALLEPVALAAIEEDNAEAHADEPDADRADHDLYDTARQVRRMAVADYRLNAPVAL